MVDVVIIGAGVAGLTAAIYVVRAGKSVLVLEAGAVGGQIVNAFKVKNWPGEIEISGADLTEKIYHQVNNLGIEVKYEEVLSIEGSKTFTVNTDENTYECKTIILATGTEPRKLSDVQTEMVGARPISYCATCDGALYSGKPVVVVGSGRTAESETMYLKNTASKVYHVHHDEAIPEEAAAVFVAIGRLPRTKFLGGFVELDGEGFVVAGEDCWTSREGVFVAGDCRTKETRQLVTAAGDGAVAAEAALHYLS